MQELSQVDEQAGSAVCVTLPQTAACVHELAGVVHEMHLHTLYLVAAMVCSNRANVRLMPPLS